MKVTQSLILFFFCIIALLHAGIQTSLASESAPIQLKIENTMVRGYMAKVATITSTVDSVTINKITINRGNTDASFANETLPRTLKFGEQYVFGVSNFLEIEVDTDKGSWVFKGKQ